MNFINAQKIIIMKLHINSTTFFYTTQYMKHLYLLFLCLLGGVADFQYLYEIVIII